jgi:Na+-driven multidrug efflux pump
MKKIFRLIWDALDGKPKDFTTGSINKAIFLLSVPLVVEMLMEASFALVDVYFVGKVSKEAVATVGLTESIVTIVYALGVGVSGAIAAMVAQRIGAKKNKEASLVGVQGILLTLFISVLIGVPGFVFAEDIFKINGCL